ncbi:3-hydroxyacyl-CoA dehydrogenase family protein [Bradyrhizobium tropiciagri]|uniref:3-hydroxyacyl-CoA dehydrogenase family protein n=1 Tax=Bradyrhizobium tropiciagri TaxID=312253 RepID=UPI00067B009E|nr:3-hydroxyacyl-CoA dehydrogenase family protein [Bradyrhizobium tropiciagri]
MTEFRLSVHGDSLSFPSAHPFPLSPEPSADILLVLGDVTRSVFDAIDADGCRAIIVELQRHCLGTLTGEDFGREGDKTVGFARYRNGRDTATNVIELVTQPATTPMALAAARDLFEAAGFVVVVAADTPGRILDRLMRPYFNRALIALDRGLASPETLDKTLVLGLGFARGPVDILRCSGLVEHFAISSELHGALGDPGFLPPRRAHVAAAAHSGLNTTEDDQ